MPSDLSQPSGRGSRHLLTRILTIVLTTIFAAWYASTIPDDTVSCITAGISLTTLLFWLVRRGERLEELSPKRRRVHLVVGGLLMSLSVITGPWAGLMGSVVWLGGFLSCQQDGDRKCSLAYLTLIPAVSVRLPFDLVDRIRSRMGAEAVRLAGLVLDDAGVLHDRGRSEIASATGTFDVSDITFAATDVAVLLSLVAVFLCFRRRRLFHAVPALMTAGGFWFLMIMGGLLAYVTQPELSEISPRVFSGACFSITILLFIVAEQGLAVLTEAIPTVTGSIVKGYGKINPCVVIWNDLTLSLTPEDVIKRKKLPPLRIAVAAGKGKLHRRLGWPFEFFGAWFTNRRWLWATLNVPLLALIGVGVWAAVKEPENQAGIYQTAMRKAMQERSLSTSGFILSRLEKEGVVDFSFMHTFAMHMVSEGHPEIAEPYIKRLTPLDRAGYLPTRKWLVRKAPNPNTMFSLDFSDRVRQLNAGLRFHPDDVDLLQLLAAEYINTGQLSLAEGLLERAVVHEPAAAGVLLRVMTQLRRDPSEIRKANDKYMRRLERSLAQTSDEDAEKVVGRAVALAQIYAGRNRTEDAEEILTRHPQALEFPEVRRALSILLTTRASNLLTVGKANAAAQNMLVRAIRLDSSNLPATQQLYRVSRRTGLVTAQAIAEEIDKLTAQLSATPGPSRTHIGLVNLLAATGRTDEAIVHLQSDENRAPSATVMLIQLLHSSGQTDDADKLLAQLRSDLVGEGSDDTSVDLSFNSIQLIATAYAAIGHRRDAIEFIDTHAQSEHEQWPAVLRNLYVENLVLSYDQKKAHGDSDLPDEYDVLERALMINPSSQRLLRKMIEISYQDTKSATEAKAYLAQRLADPNRVHGTRKAMSVVALLHEDYEEALKLLRRCVEREADDPAVLNNLAVACIRCSAGNASEALNWIEQALEQAPHHTEFRATRAEVLIALQRWDEARDDVDAVLDADPTHEEALAMRTTIHRRR